MNVSLYYYINTPVFHQHASNFITLWHFPVICQILKSFCAFVNVYLLTLSPHIPSNSKIKQLFCGLILRGNLPSIGSKIELILSKVSSKHILGFPGGSVGKESACNEETWVQSLGQEDPLEREMATDSTILVWRIPGTEEPGGLQSMRSQRIEHDWITPIFWKHLP